MSASRAEITRRLFEFYDRAGRDLPWRHTTDPYAIWVSEVMLQQTRVETVLPYFTAWMTRFPTVDSVANADLEDVLTVWTGLGYYSRARSLHRAARTVRDEFGGRLPEDARRLQSLPGIGAYTAGAIASIAYGAPVPAVDGNVLRVIARLFDLPVATPTTVRPYVLSLLDAGRPGDLNQSIMDLGATVCTPSAPKCDECPLREDCLARAHQTVEHRPAKRSRRPLRTRCFAAAVCVSDGMVWVEKRAEEGLLGGMWEFPNDETEQETGAERAAFRSFATSRGATSPIDPMPEPHALGVVTHKFTHFKARYEAFLFDLGGSMKREAGVRSKWVSIHELEGLALSIAQQKIGALARAALDGPYPEPADERRPVANNLNVNSEGR